MFESGVSLQAITYGNSLGFQASSGKGLGLAGISMMGISRAVMTMTPTISKGVSPRARGCNTHSPRDTSNQLTGIIASMPRNAISGFSRLT